MFVPRRRRLLAGFVALLVVLLAACDANPPDRRADAQAFTDQVRAMPGVTAASNDVADSRAQGMVYFTVYVDTADDLSADQLTAITPGTCGSCGPESMRAIAPNWTCVTGGTCSQ